MTNTLSLIRQIVTDQDADAADRLLSIIKDHHMDREIRRWHGRNVLVDDDDIASHYLEGCYLALSKVRMDVGNPLLYILWRGRMNVSTLFRSRLRQGVRARCQLCGFISMVRLAQGWPRCRACGSSRLQTWMIEDTPAIERKHRALALFPDSVQMECDLWFDRAIYQVQIDEMRARLTGRVLQLFDLLVLEGINAQTSQNYLREIAERWGITRTCVAIYLRKLRSEILRYFEKA